MRAGRDWRAAAARGVAARCHRAPLARIRLLSHEAAIAMLADGQILQFGAQVEVAGMTAPGIPASYMSRAREDG